MTAVTRLLVTLVIFGLAGCAATQQPATQQPLPSVPQGVPRFVHAPNPDYPLEARRQGIAGTVVIEYLIVEDGTTRWPNVYTSVHPLLDQAVASGPSRGPAPPEPAAAAWLPVDDPTPEAAGRPPAKSTA